VDTGSREENAAESLKPFAGVGVTQRQHEEAEAKGQHEDVQHQVLLVALVSLRHACMLQGRRIALDLHGIAGAIRACRNSGREVPLAAYVFEAGAQAIL